MLEEFHNWPACKTNIFNTAENFVLKETVAGSHIQETAIFVWVCFLTEPCTSNTNRFSSSCRVALNRDNKWKVKLPSPNEQFADSKS